MTNPLSLSSSCSFTSCGIDARQGPQCWPQNSMRTTRPFKSSRLSFGPYQFSPRLTFSRRVPFSELSALEHAERARTRAPTDTIADLLSHPGLLVPPIVGVRHLPPEDSIPQKAYILQKKATSG